MNRMSLLIELVKALATPAAALVALYWFSKPISTVFEAVAYFIRERKFKTNFPGGSVEVGDEAREQAQRVQDQIAAIPSPADTHAPVSEVVEARRFILRDDEGRARVDIGLVGKEESRYPAIRLLDTSGGSRVMVMGDEHALSGIVVGGPDEGLVALTTSKERGPFLIANDLDRKVTASLTPTIFSLSDGAVFLGATKDGSPFIVLQDKEGKEVFVAR